MPAPSLLPFASGLRRWLDALPSQCAVCQAWPAHALCQACVARFAMPVPRCRSCALRLPAGVAQCGDCLRQPPALDACLAACDYRWPWPEAIARLKFRQDVGWAAPLATLLRATPGAEAALEAADAVLPVPLSAARLRQRGFNQALELARRLAPERCEARLLLRLRDTPAQIGLGRERRLHNLRDAFALEPRRADAVAGRRLVLVDDVMTTGATLQAAAQVLRAAGAAHITGLVLARTEAPG